MTATVARSGPKPLRISTGSSSTRPLGVTAGVLGFELWPWQARAGRVSLSRRAGRWRYPIVLATVPRQSGKTRLVMTVCVDRALRQPGAQVWYTAQSRVDAVLRFNDLVSMLRASSLVEGVGRRLDDPWDFKVKIGMGCEEVTFSNGSQVRIFAPAVDSLHGSVTDLVVLDEARFFDAYRGDGLMAAVLPTQATRDGQVFITSTAGGPESMFLRRQLEAARASHGAGGHMGVVEYGLGDREVPAGELLEAVWAAHPAAGLLGGPRREALEVAYEQMPAWQFAHEFGNRWRTEADERLIPAGVWDACRYEPPLPPGRPVFAVDIPLDRSESPIVACVDGVVELVDLLPAAEVPNRVLELSAAWDPLAVVVDAAGPAGTVAERLRPVFDRLVISSTQHLAAACGMFYDALADGSARVRPALALTAAAAAARKRQVGQSWVWSRVDGGAPLVAASLAFWQWSKLAAVPVVDEEPAIF